MERATRHYLFGGETLQLLRRRLDASVFSSRNLFISSLSLIRKHGTAPWWVVTRVAATGSTTMVAATPLELGSSSVTVLRSGADFVVAAGLCGWLRAWQLRPAELTSEEVRTVSQQASTLTFYPLSPPEILIGAYHPFRRGCSYSTSAARTTCPTDARAPTRSGAPRWPNLSPP
jgi:hypothetical protein